MFFKNSNTPIPDNRYMVFVTDTASLATGTTSALYGRISFNYRTLSATDAGFVGNGTTFLSLLQGATFSDVEAKLMVTDIVVLGGNNDRQKGVVAGIIPAMETFANYCKQHFPLAKVWVGMTGWADAGLDNSAYINVGLQFKDVVEGYSRAGAYGMCFMDNVQYATHKTNFWEDTFTLTTFGANWIGGYIAECLLNGSTTVYEVSVPTVTYRSGCSAVGNTKIYTSINNNIASVYIRNGTSAQCGFNFPSRYITPRKYYAPIPICDLGSSWVTGRVNEYADLASPWGQMQNSDGAQTNEWARWMLKGRTLYVQFICTHPNDNPGAEISYQFSRVVFYGNKMITCDAMYC